MRWEVLVVLPLCGCETIFPLEPPEPIRRTIVIDQPTLTALDNFPVSIQIDGDPDIDKGIGSDFRFVDSDGQPLDHEIELFRPEAQAFNAWVRIPILTPEPVTIEMLWGDRVEASSTLGAVWQAPFEGVWHMNETTSEQRDSTTFDRRFAVTVGVAPDEVTGPSHPARAFTAADQMCLPAINDVDPAADSFSYSMWVKATMLNTDADRALSKGGGTSSVPGFNFELGSAAWVANIADGMKLATTEVVMDPGGQVGAWVHVVGVIDRSGDGFFRGYSNGELIDTTTPLSIVSLTTSIPTCLGDPTDKPFTGEIDEVMFYRGALSAEWIAVHYANLAKRATMITIAE